MNDNTNAISHPDSCQCKECDQFKLAKSRAKFKEEPQREFPASKIWPPWEWSRHEANVTDKPVPPGTEKARLCAQCGSGFLAKRWDAKTCGARCRKRASRREVAA